MNNKVINEAEKYPVIDKSKKFLRKDLHIAYQVAAESRNDYRTRIWETLKIAALIATGSLAGVGGILAGKIIPNQLVVIPGIWLIILGFYLTYWTYSNVKREQGLLYQDEFTLYQIEKLLCLHESTPEEYRWMPDAPNIFAQKHVDYSYKFKKVEIEETDPVVKWSNRKLSEQYFLKQILIGFSGIFLISMLAIGLLIIFSSIFK